MSRGGSGAVEVLRSRWVEVRRGLWCCCPFDELLAVGVVVPTGWLVESGLVALLLCAGSVSSAAEVVISAGCSRWYFPSFSALVCMGWVVLGRAGRGFV